MKNEKSVVVLKGEGSHVHELVGDFSIKLKDFGGSSFLPGKITTKSVIGFADLSFL